MTTAAAAAAAAASHDGGADDPDSPPSSLGTPMNQQEREHGADDDATAAAAAAVAKKLRACEACRALKVRCEPDLTDESAPCRRCGKAGRSCVVTMPTRKRQKKTDSRVLELEKKIDALTASLQARAAVPAMGPSKVAYSEAAVSGSWINSGSTRGRAMTASPKQQSRTPRPHRSSVLETPDTATGRKRKAASEHRDVCADDGKTFPTAAGVASSSSLSSLSSSLSSSSSSSTSQWPSPGRGQRCDVIDRGIISAERATDLFQRYKEHMLPHLPAVVFPPSMTLTELRRSKPYLFLAVMAAASSETVRIQHTLQRELMELFAEKIIIVGEKSLELIQALHVAVIWYWPPEHFEELKFYQLVHMAAVMALDIGLGKKSSARRGMSNFAWRDHHDQHRGPHDAGPQQQQQKQPPQPPLDPTSLECRRAWLTCHFLAANTSMSLHRPHLIRWTPFMTESLEVLRSSPDALPTDGYFCHLVWTHRMAEKIGLQLCMDDADAVVSILDSRTQHTLGELERELDGYVATVPKDMMQPTLRMGLGILNLYMHEMALHSDDTAPDGPVVGGATAAPDKSGPSLCGVHINALAACLGAVNDTFQTFLAMDVLAIRCLPVFTFVRVAYTVVILIRMYLSASELGGVVDRDQMRVAYYLEALLDKFSATAADDKCRPASKFLRVLVMLRTWFLKHAKGEGRGHGGGGGSSSGETAMQQQQQQQQHNHHHHHHHHHHEERRQQQQHQQIHDQAQPRLQLQQQQQQPQPPRQHRHHRNQPPFASTPAPPPPPQHHHQHHQHHHHPPPPPPLASSTTTPLQLLSEVAMGTESAPRPNPPPYTITTTTTTNPPLPQTYYPNPPTGPLPLPGIPPPWMNHQQHHQQQPLPPPPPIPEPTTTIGFPADFDFDALGVPLDNSGDMYTGGARIVLNDPMFSDMFRVLPDTSFFEF